MSLVKENNIMEQAHNKITEGLYEEAKALLEEHVQQDVMNMQPRLLLNLLNKYIKESHNDID